MRVCVCVCVCVFVCVGMCARVYVSTCVREIAMYARAMYENSSVSVYECVHGVYE